MNHCAIRTPRNAATGVPGLTAYTAHVGRVVTSSFRHPSPATSRATRRSRHRPADGVAGISGRRADRRPRREKFLAQACRSHVPNPRPSSTETPALQRRIRCAVGERVQEADGLRLEPCGSPTQALSSRRGVLASWHGRKDRGHHGVGARCPSRRIVAFPSSASARREGSPVEPAESHRARDHAPPASASSGYGRR